MNRVIRQLCSYLDCEDSEDLRFNIRNALQNGNMGGGNEEIQKSLLSQNLNMYDFRNILKNILLAKLGSFMKRSIKGTSDVEIGRETLKSSYRYLRRREDVEILQLSNRVINKIEIYLNYTLKTLFPTPPLTVDKFRQVRSKFPTPIITEERKPKRKESKNRNDNYTLGRVNPKFFIEMLTYKLLDTDSSIILLHENELEIEAANDSISEIDKIISRLPNHSKEQPKEQKNVTIVEEFISEVVDKPDDDYDGEETTDFNHSIPLQKNVIQMMRLPQMQGLPTHLLENYIYFVAEKAGVKHLIDRVVMDHSLGTSLLVFLSSSSGIEVIAQFLDLLDLSEYTSRVLRKRKVMFFPLRQNSSTRSLGLSRLENQCLVTILGMEFSNPDYGFLCTHDIVYNLTLQVKELFNDCGMIVSVKISHFSQQVHVLFRTAEGAEKAIAKKSDQTKNFKVILFHPSLSRMTPQNMKEKQLNYQALDIHYSRYSFFLGKLGMFCDSSYLSPKPKEILIFNCIIVGWNLEIPKYIVSNSQISETIKNLIEKNCNGKVELMSRVIGTHVNLKFIDYTSAEKTLKALQGEEVTFFSADPGRSTSSSPQRRESPVRRFLKLDIHRGNIPFSSVVKIYLVSRVSTRGRSGIRETFLSFNPKRVNQVIGAVARQIDVPVSKAHDNDRFCYRLVEPGDNENKVFGLRSGFSYLLVGLNSSEDVLKVLSLDLTESYYGELYRVGKSGKNTYLDVFPVPVSPYSSELERDSFCVQIAPQMKCHEVEYLRMKFLMCNRFGRISMIEEKDDVWFVHFLDYFEAKKLRDTKNLKFQRKPLRIVL